MYFYLDFTVHATLHFARDGNASHGRSIASDNTSGDNSDHSGEILSQNGKKQQVKTATARGYTSRLEKMWFRNYYVAYAFV